MILHCKIFINDLRKKHESSEILNITYESDYSLIIFRENENIYYVYSLYKEEIFDTSIISKQIMQNTFMKLAEQFKYAKVII